MKTIHRHWIPVSQLALSRAVKVCEVEIARTEEYGYSRLLWGSVVPADFASFHFHHAAGAVAVL